LLPFRDARPNRAFFNFLANDCALCAALSPFLNGSCPPCQRALFQALSPAALLRHGPHRFHSQRVNPLQHCGLKHLNQQQNIVYSQSVFFAILHVFRRCTHFRCTAAPPPPLDVPHRTSPLTLLTTLQLPPSSLLPKPFAIQLLQTLFSLCFCFAKDLHAEPSLVRRRLQATALS